MSNSESRHAGVRTQSENAADINMVSETSPRGFKKKPRPKDAGNLYTAASANPVRDKQRDVFSQAAANREEARGGSRAAAYAGAGSGSRDMAPLVKDISPVRRAVNAFFAFVLTIGLMLPTTALSAIPAMAAEGDNLEQPNNNAPSNNDYSFMPLAYENRYPTIQNYDNLGGWAIYEKNPSKEIKTKDNLWNSDQYPFNIIDFTDNPLESYTSLRAFFNDINNKYELRLKMGWDKRPDDPAQENWGQYSIRDAIDLSHDYDLTDNGQYPTVVELFPDTGNEGDIYSWQNTNQAPQNGQREARFIVRFPGTVNAPKYNDVTSWELKNGNTSLGSVPESDAGKTVILQDYSRSFANDAVFSKTADELQALTIWLTRDDEPSPLDINIKTVLYNQDDIAVINGAVYRVFTLIPNSEAIYNWSSTGDSIEYKIYIKDTQYSSVVSNVSQWMLYDNAGNIIGSINDGDFTNSVFIGDYKLNRYKPSNYNVFIN